MRSDGERLFHAKPAMRLMYAAGTRVAGLIDMSLVELLVLLLVAGICGALGKAIVGYLPGGFFVSIGVGFVGALIGSWIAHAVGLQELFAIRIGGTTFPIVWSILGSVVFVAILAVIGRGFATRTWT